MVVYENSVSGEPLMRPLFFEESENTSLLDYSETYLWGHDILVAPVLEAGKQTQSVYFPKGSKWFDFYGLDIIDGGQTIDVPTVESHIPTYVRAGAFIPMARNITNTLAYDGGTMIMHYYHDEDVNESDRDFYFDDGSNNAYENGKYEILEFEAEMEGKWLEIDLEAKWGDNYKPGVKRIQFMIHNMDGYPEKVEFNKEEVRARWIKDDKVLRVELNWNTSESSSLRLKVK